MADELLLDLDELVLANKAVVVGDVFGGFGLAFGLRLFGLIFGLFIPFLISVLGIVRGG